MVPLVAMPPLQKTRTKILGIWRRKSYKESISGIRDLPERWIRGNRQRMNGLADTGEQEAEIDRLVYEMYELADEEVAAVEDV